MIFESLTVFPIIYSGDRNLQKKYLFIINLSIYLFISPSPAPFLPLLFPTPVPPVLSPMPIVGTIFALIKPGGASLLK
jgi:hypothetical protein